MVTSAKDIHLEVYYFIDFGIYRCIRTVEILTKRKETRMQIPRPGASQNEMSVTISARILLDGHLLDLSCDVLEDICGLDENKSFEKAIMCKEIDQLHDSLTLIRSGILNFRNEENEKGDRIIVMEIICKAENQNRPIEP